MPLPHLGINEYVRVCDGCHIKLKLDKSAIAASTSTSSIKKPAEPVQSPPQGDAFDDDMKKAIELSLKEAEQQKNAYGAGYVAPVQQPVVQQQPVEEDPDLAAAIAASLRDLEISKNQHESAAVQQVRKNDLSPVEMENILLFSTLMDRIYATGGDASNDSQITQLYTQIGALQPKLIKNLDETIQKRQAFIQLSEKLNAAVRAYDRLLEDRINNVRQHSQDTAYYNIPYQQDTNKYYNNQDVNPYYTPSYPQQQQYSGQQQYSAPPANTAQQQYTAPPASTATQQYATQNNYATTQQQYPAGAPPQNTAIYPSEPVVDEAPLIDLE